MNTPFTRKNVWLRDKGICRYCGNPVSPEQMVLIHVIPMSQGGPNTWDNVVTGCVECSVRKCALIQVVDGLNECEKAQLKQKGYTSAAFFTEAGELTPQYTWYAKEKKKYINIDCGGSGAFMVDKATGEIQHQGVWDS